LENEYNNIIKGIKDIIIKSILTITEETIVVTKGLSKYPNTLFEIYGYDIFIDSNYRPWLLEVNVSPSLNCDSELDLNIKSNLLIETINIIGIPNSNDEVKLPEISKGNTLQRIKISKEFDTRNPNFDLLDYDPIYDKMIIQYLDEIRKSRDFKQIFPQKENIKTYCKFIKNPFDENIILWKWIMSYT
jgi:tubulin polyglutamylase TTLL5